MEIQGRILKLGATQAVSATFQKREVVIMTDEQYPQYIPFDFVQEKCALLDAFQENQVVRISFNLRGREWVNPQGETKYIVNLQGWRIEAADAYPPQGYAPQQGYAYPPQGYMPPQQMQGYGQMPPQQMQGYGQMPPQQQFQQMPPQQFQQMPPQHQQMPPQQPQNAFEGVPPVAPPPVAAAAEEDDLPF